MPRRLRSARSPVALLGNVDDARRDAAYASASVVVCPALREDYGLTVLGAMRWGRPVIVCEDGGGLVELVEDTGAGLIVEPEPAAIAEAIDRIVGGEGEAMSAAATEAAARITWDRCYGELDAALSAVAG